MSEKVLLAVVDFKKRDACPPLSPKIGRRAWSVEDNIKELTELVLACGGEVVGSVVCPVVKPTPNFLIGKGKVEEIAALCVTNGADMVIVSHDLKGSQQRNLEENFKVKTIDRTQLILDIFARRAKSQEGKMQVELAQLAYLLPRLVGHGTELSRLGGGIGTLGPGETKLEVDRRRISTRIDKLKQSLKEVSSQRETTRKKRKDYLISNVSLVGYTNAGKSTLLNCLTHADQEMQDGLFTTLDSLSRQLVLPNHQKIILSDTVGFIHDLPHHLIESFKTTLEEVKDADLLLHVVDVSRPNFRQLKEAVDSVLTQLEADQKPTITVFNKIDQIPDRAWLEDLKKNFEPAVCLSALSGEHVPDLLNKIAALLAEGLVELDVKIPLNRMDLVNLLHSQGQVHSIQYSPESIHIQATVPAKLAQKCRF